MRLNFIIEVRVFCKAGAKRNLLDFSANNPSKNGWCITWFNKRIADMLGGN